MRQCTRTYDDAASSHRIYMYITSLSSRYCLHARQIDTTSLRPFTAVRLVLSFLLRRMKYKINIIHLAIQFILLPRFKILWHLGICIVLCATRVKGKSFIMPIKVKWFVIHHMYNYKKKLQSRSTLLYALFSSCLLLLHNKYNNLFCISWHLRIYV